MVAPRTPGGASDSSHWFSDSTGAALNPSDPTNLGAILNNIRCSIRLIADDDGDKGDHCAVLSGVPVTP